MTSFWKRMERKSRVLLVGDDAAVLANRAQLVEELGYQPLVIKGGYAAADFLQQDFGNKGYEVHRSIDVIVTELRMTDREGKSIGSGYTVKRARDATEKGIPLYFIDKGDWRARDRRELVKPMFDALIAHDDQERLQKILRLSLRTSVSQNTSDSGTSDNGTSESSQGQACGGIALKVSGSVLNRCRPLNNTVEEALRSAKVRDFVTELMEYCVQLQDKGIQTVLTVGGGDRTHQSYLNLMSLAENKQLHMEYLSERSLEFYANLRYLQKFIPQDRSVIVTPDHITGREKFDSGKMTYRLVEEDSFFDLSELLQQENRIVLLSSPPRHLTLECPELYALGRLTGVPELGQFPSVPLTNADLLTLYASKMFGFSNAVYVKSVGKIWSWNPLQGRAQGTERWRQEQQGNRLLGTSTYLVLLDSLNSGAIEMTNTAGFANSCLAPHAAAYAQLAGIDIHFVESDPCIFYVDGKHIITGEEYNPEKDTWQAQLDAIISGSKPADLVSGKLTPESMRKRIEQYKTALRVEPEKSKRIIRSMDHLLETM